MITNRAGVLKSLERKFPQYAFEHAAVGKRGNAKPLSSASFFWETAGELPQDLRGCCCLVGAGPWAEIYCTWIKQRGGVGIDIGSGFDLLDGVALRPVHRRIGLDKVNQYAL